MWTVKVTTNLSYTLQLNINFILRIYIEASVRRFKLESLIMAQNVRWRHA